MNMFQQMFQRIFFLQIAQSADTKEQMGRQGLEAQGAGAAELAKLVRADGENYRKVFKAAGIPMQ